MDKARAEGFRRADELRHVALVVGSFHKGPYVAAVPFERYESSSIEDEDAHRPSKDRAFAFSWGVNGPCCRSQSEITLLISSLSERLPS